MCKRWQLERLGMAGGHDRSCEGAFQDHLENDGPAGLLQCLLQHVREDPLENVSFDEAMVASITTAVDKAFEKKFGAAEPQEVSIFYRALRAACLLRLRESACRVLDAGAATLVVSEDTPQLTEKERSANGRLAVVCEKLWKRQDSSDGQRWQPPISDHEGSIDSLAKRLLPESADAQTVREPLHWLLAAQQRLGPAYDVLFPVVDTIETDETKTDRGFLLNARLTVLHDSGASASGPLVQAPWSVWVLNPDDVKILNQELSGCLESVPNLARSERLRFLLELRPPEIPELTPPALCVEGQSLGLAVVLAAWAASTSRHFSRIAATGAIQAQGQIGSVKGIAAKYSAVVKYARWASGRWAFLMPAKDNPPAEDGVALVQLDSLQTLFRQEHDLLTDGFDEYRNAILKRADWWDDLAATTTEPQ